MITEDSDKGDWDFRDASCSSSVLFGSHPVCKVMIVMLVVQGVAVDEPDRLTSGSGRLREA